MKAFTLAEVLITLTIIGVVAAVTVPTLTKKTGNQEIVTRLQKAYSILSQATDEIMIEKGKPANNWAELFKEHLKNSKECDDGLNSGCFDQKIKYLNGNYRGGSLGASSSPKLILADGMQVMLVDENADCKPRCMEFYVDVNGKKKPNQLGRDIFLFDLTNTGLYPRGCEKSPHCTVDGQGWDCACNVLMEGEINY